LLLTASLIAEKSKAASSEALLKDRVDVKVVTISGVVSHTHSSAAAVVVAAIVVAVVVAALVVVAIVVAACKWRLSGTFVSSDNRLFASQVKVAKTPSEHAGVAVLGV